MVETLISFVFATSILAISPGPDNIFVLTQSIVNGKKYGFATIFGLMTGCLIHTSLVAFGVSALIKENENLFFVLKLFGAIYLIYLAYKVFKSDTKIIFSTQNVSLKTTTQLFKTGFLMNVLNPKVTIFFLAFFSQFLFSHEISMILQFYILGLIFILVSFVIFGGIALLGGKVSTYLMHQNNIGLVIKWAQIVVFVGIALLILI
ncbi:MAG: LysE family translocator [Flavobacteriia bacterium]|nr:LysE family translocator [Flavobacteriia bacterium]OIP48771.1 MAG: lysine transporter LysE [Flavobacteriaceae bacterium CG2_30_31_66]PIV95490.1 MAG: lysine transporter LysE [Flavobacteriaceae bacterium CG17_big_fil_post_rev_8_21_14_2_50_31_13]PIX14093.1 MAG: lysine transporter LysE [Flavobacteriaceae bacterium CG_4_8_14_3_um_filter_31_8]PIY14199.1 MAG: lysine transporter LysE [Flavobacteriaceae bacterium CG_4_10_14_3_um_filter_31_253]PIZ10308.1 MAG: lysine transporter LysE [Flavobacteriacea